MLNGEFMRQSLEDRLDSAMEVVEKLRNGHLLLTEKFSCLQRGLAVTDVRTQWISIVSEFTS